MSMTESERVLQLREKGIKRALNWGYSFHDAEDLVQSTFLGMLSSENSGNFDAKLFNYILTRRMSDEYRDRFRASAKVRVKGCGILMERAMVHSYKTNYGGRMDDVSLSEEVRELVGGIAVRDAEAFVLHYVGGLDQREVGEALEINKWTAKTRFRRGRDIILQELLRRHLSLRDVA
jgi:RNA polymerase sigma factor (sigma-70 family)